MRRIISLLLTLIIVMCSGCSDYAPAKQVVNFTVEEKEIYEEAMALLEVEPMSCSFVSLYLEDMGYDSDDIQYVLRNSDISWSDMAARVATRWLEEDQSLTPSEISDRLYHRAEFSQFDAAIGANIAYENWRI